MQMVRTLRIAPSIRPVLLLLLFLLHNQKLKADTPDALHQRILAGGQIYLSPSAPEDTRTINADWIKEAVLNHARVQIRNAVIRGRLDLQDFSVEQDFDLAGCTVQDYADFSHTTFKRDVFASDVVFASGVSFQSVTFEHKSTFQRTRFEGAPIIFSDAHFIGVFSAAEARFVPKGGGTAIFTHARFDSTADFAFSFFGSDAHFITTQFGGQGYFPGARFGGSADFSRAHFFDITTFGAGTPSNFNASFVGQAFFVETQFDSITLFTGVTFDSDVNFFSARFGPLAQFSGTTFKGSAVFDRVEIVGAAKFSSQQPDATSDLSQSAHFEKTVSFSAVHFGSVARFSGVRFDDKTEFIGAHFDNDAHFENSLFQAPTSFRSAIFRAVYFSTTEAGKTRQFGSRVDLLGCTYDRIQVNWRTLFKYPDGQSRIDPYDRQPYVELEEVLRRSGFAEDADAVYAERRRVENLKMKGLRKFFDCLYGLIANYGIDLWNELELAAVFIVFGTLIFACPGAVVKNGKEMSIPRWTAFFFAFHQFLPFSLPVKPEWTPSKRGLLKWRHKPLVTAASYANFLQIVGWILIPLAAAAMSGVLRHTAQ